MKLKRIFCLVFILALLSATALPAMGAEKKEAKFKDGKFKIMLISDTQDTSSPSKDMPEFIAAALKQEKPDFVILLGDNLAGYWYGIQFGREKKVKKAIDAFIKPINDAKIPFAFVYGNHDAGTEISLEDQMKIYQSYEYCMAVDDGAEISGCGTYNIPVKNSAGDKNIFNLWFFDVSEGAPDNTQLQWYEKTSNALKAQNGGVPLPSLAFQHIMLPEIYETLTEVPEGTEGAVPGRGEYEGKFFVPNPSFQVRSAVQNTELRENIHIPKDRGEFDSFQKQGDVIGLYAGHNHTNEYVATLKGIDLGFTPTCGFHMYGPGNNRAFRIIELSESNVKDYSSHLIYFPDVMGRNPRSTFHDTALSDFWRTYNTYIIIGGVVVIAAGIVAGVLVSKKKNKLKKA